MTGARIVCLGGGPGGLYAALLLKKADPSRDVSVIDRNPAHATYGWGVVFSDETLAFLQDADRESYAAIVDTFIHWTLIETRYRGEIIRSGGHAFSGMGRHRLLNILQSRCSDVGVNLRFGEEFGTLDAYRDCDLVIVADGLNSQIREQHADTFKPSFDAHATRFIWLGAKWPIDAFTFIFRETQWGIFTVHAYPFDAETSTFIVEVRDETWRAAGLERAGEEESLAFCSELFAADLQGKPLLSNRSSWIEFVTLKNETWRHDNLVLLGDAAHTAHFSIGSGTKMAMEDAIALTHALETHPHDLRRALVDYEELRIPIVERTQAAARESSRWFEHVGRYAAFEPTQFSFSLLTRSKRVTYENLRLRDQTFSTRVDQWFSRNSPPGAFPPPQPVLNGFALREMSLPNRVAVRPPSMDVAIDGAPAGWHLARLGGAAMTGVGLVMTEMVAVSAEGRITPGSAGLYTDGQSDAWSRVVDLVHSHAKASIGLQLGHAGRRGATRRRTEGLDRPLRVGGWPLVSASVIPYAVASDTPAELDRAGMTTICEQFVAATERATQAGFDLLEINAGNGYLLGSFLSPLSNMRDDEWGGSAPARLRFPLEIIAAVRHAWPSTLPLSVCLSVSDWARGSINEDEAISTCRALKEHGVDLIHVSSGHTTGDANPPYGRAWETHLSDAIRNEAQIATIVGGNLAGADEMNTLLSAGRADLCFMAPRLLDHLPWLIGEPKEPALKALQQMLMK